MRINGIIWLETVVDKLHRKHRVTTDEVEEVLSGKPSLRRMEAGDVQGEDLYAALGRAGSGRHLVVFFVLKRDGDALVVSARDMAPKERRLYGRKG